MAYVFIVKSITHNVDEGNDSKRRIYSTLKSANRAARKETRALLVDCGEDDDEDHLIVYDSSGHFKACGQIDPYKEFSVTVKKMRILGPDLHKGEEDESSGEEDEGKSDEFEGDDDDDDDEMDAEEVSVGEKEITEDVGDEVEIIKGYRRPIY
jgi:hypothetical protein